jgi:hypothetical protein
MIIPHTWLTEWLQGLQRQPPAWAQEPSVSTLLGNIVSLLQKDDGKAEKLLHVCAAKAGMCAACAHLLQSLPAGAAAAAASQRVHALQEHGAGYAERHNHSGIDLLHVQPTCGVEHRLPAARLQTTALSHEYIDFAVEHSLEVGRGMLHPTFALWLHLCLFLPA